MLMILLEDFKLITPELAVLVTALLLILLDLFIKQKKVLAGIAIAGVAVAIGFTISLWGIKPADVFYSMLAVDQFTLFFKLLILAAVGLVVLASQDYVSKFSRFQGEYYALLLISALGMMLLTAAADLITVFVALELSGISLYILTAFLKDDKSSEAGLKYLFLGATASAVLLFGMAFIYGTTGKTCLVCISGAIQALSLAGLLSNPALMLGMVLLIAGFGFKIASFPFQMWAPDVYEGAPTPVTAYISVASKAAGFAVLIRVFLTAFGAPAWLSFDWGMIFAILSAVTMTAGNIAALLQNNIKRMLAYSSIAQAGYLMVGLAVVGIAAKADTAGQAGILFFLLSYTVTNLGAFTAIIAISGKVESDMIDDYAGMSKRAPMLALALAFCLISLIGLPPTGGLIAKIYIFSGAVQHGLLWLVVIGVINSCISAFYYLRVVRVMCAGSPSTEGKVPSSLALRFALAICCILVLVLGIIPGGFLDLAQSAVRMFGG
jgi:NADH-quinone oxidoreductase subunit N